MINTNKRTLLLNANFYPISYFPLSLVHWQNAIKAAFLGRVNIVSEYDIEIRSKNTSMKIPSVVSLKKFITFKSTPTFNRFNVFLRDDFTCQYCMLKLPAHELTFDHVVPKFKNGKTNWDNVVTACTVCNFRKGHQNPEDVGLTLRKVPTEPTQKELQKNGKKYPPRYLHKSWMDYLYWDSSFENN